MLRLERAACRWEIAHFSPSRPEPTRAGTTAPPTAVSSVGSGTKRIKRTDLRHRRSQGACGSSVAAVGTVNNDIGRYVGSVCLVHIGGSRPPVTLSSSANETTIHGRRRGAIVPGPQPPPIILTERQRNMLAHLARRVTSTQRLARRARIVLAAAEGANNEQIAERLGINRETSRLWRGVWLENEVRLGVAREAGEKELRPAMEQTLCDRARSGAPPTFSAEQVCQIVAMACEAPSHEWGRAVRHWSTTELAEEALKRGSFTSVEELQRRILEFVEYFNRTMAKPFKWTCIWAVHSRSDADGLFSPRCTRGEMFGFPRLRALIAEHGEERALE